MCAVGIATCAHIKLLWQRLRGARQQGPDHPEVGRDWAKPLHSPMCWHYGEHKPPALHWSIRVEGVLLAGQRQCTQALSTFLSGILSCCSCFCGACVVLHTQTCLAPISSRFALQGMRRCRIMNRHCLAARNAGSP